MKKRILKWVIGILLTPIILFFISATLLYLPPIQDFAVRKATAYLSETTGMKVHIGRLRLTFLFDIDLQDVQIKDGQDDSLLDVERLSVDLSFASLLHGEIDVEGIELTRAAVNTKSMIAGVEIKGSIGRFFVNSHGIEIPQEMVTVNTALLSDADVAIALTDSTTEDTTASSPVNWKIALGQVDLARTRVRFSMPGDSMTVSGGILTAALRNGLIDLGQALYTVETFDLHADSLFYDLPYEKTAEGLDVNHIALRDIGLGIDSITFDGNALGLSLALRETHMKEKSGLEIRSLTGHFNMDSTSLHVPELVLRTPDSYIRTQADMDLSAVAEQPQGKMSARLMGELGKQDVLLFAGGLPPAFVKAYPNSPVILRLSADGNLDTLNLTTVEARLAGAFELKDVPVGGLRTKVGTRESEPAYTQSRFCEGIGRRRGAERHSPAPNATGRECGAERTKIHCRPPFKGRKRKRASKRRIRRGTHGLPGETVHKGPATPSFLTQRFPVRPVSHGICQGRRDGFLQPTYPDAGRHDIRKPAIRTTVSQ